MVTTLDLKELSKDELQVLHKEIDVMLDSWDEQQFKDARQKVEEYARELGYSLSELAGKYRRRKSRSRSRRRKQQRPPKYRSPDDAGLTWSGMGRRPLWLVEVLNSGTSLEEMRIR